MTTATMDKIERLSAHFLLDNGSPFHVRIELREKESCAPHLTVDGEECRTYLELSICGDCAGSGGQTLDTLRKHCKDKDARKLCEIWDRWHLNGMKAGSRKQNEALKEFKASNALKDYDERNAFLDARGLRIDLSFPMPAGAPAGYAYGTAWLVEPLPDDIPAKLRAICERHDKATIEGEDDVAARWQSLVDQHSEDAVAAVRTYLGGQLVPSDDDDKDDVWTGGDIDQAESMLEEYRGEWPSFRAYAENFADDIGAINKDSTWPNNHIDWEAAASELERDYTVLEHNGSVHVFLDV